MAGLRRYRLVFNVFTDDVAAIVGGYIASLAAVADGRAPGRPVRAIVGDAFTRGHFSRAV